MSLTTKEDSAAKRPHQAFLVVKEAVSGLEAPFPLTVKESGKAMVQIVCLVWESNPITPCPSKRNEHSTGETGRERFKLTLSATAI